MPAESITVTHRALTDRSPSCLVVPTESARHLCELFLVCIAPFGRYIMNTNSHREADCVIHLARMEHAQELTTEKDYF
jgi:hypothetical protein